MSVATPSFDALGVPAPLVRALADRGITNPFPIQAATLPDSLAGRDVLGRGRTGSGKTVAFALPTVAALAASHRPRRASRPRALVLLPTRELANQVADTMRPLAEAMGLKTTTVFGGVSQNPQVTALRAGVDVLVACPGRLEDLLGQGLVHLDDVEVTVLDEADHMADLGFLPGVKRLLDRTPRDAQRLLFSATLDNGIDVLVKRYLHDPVTHSVDPAVAPVATMTHHVLAVEKDDKAAVVRELASGQGRTLLFMRTKHTAKKLARQLTANGIPAVDLHGNLSQNARERNLDAFSTGTVRVLVATDIAARGIHVDEVGLVVHVDPPAEHKAYLHRSGRTARAGADGVVVTVMTPDQAADVRVLTRQAGISPVRTSVAPGALVLRELTGPRAALVSATDIPAVAATTAPRQPSGTAKAPAAGSRPGGISGRSGGGSARSGGGSARSGGGSGRSGGAGRRGPASQGAGAQSGRRRPRRPAA
jgi:superfamily II DNA/RNA helicase